VTAVLVTGMSGTGKSSVLAELARRGHRVVDTDYGDWIEEVSMSGGTERLWRKNAIETLLDDHADGTLFVSGCVANQGTFYPRFDAVVLLSAPAEVILERVATRGTNRFGRAERERAAILRDLEEIEPLLRVGATAELDTRASLEEVANALERISAETTPRRSAPSG
jgi:dephospho-CoA kinase